MKNMKVKTFLITLPLIFASLSACNGGGGDNSKQGGNSDNVVTIKFWHTFGQTVVDGLKSKINDFKQLVKQNDGVDVEVDLKYQGSYDDCALCRRSTPTW